MTIPTLYLRLCTNATNGHYDEVEGHGYAPRELDPSRWVTRDATAEYPVQVFRFTSGGLTVNGWYLTTQAGTAIGGNLFAPVTIESADDSLAIEVEVQVVAVRED